MDIELVFPGCLADDVADIGRWGNELDDLGGVPAVDMLELAPVLPGRRLDAFALLLFPFDDATLPVKSAVAIGTLSPNNSAFKTVAKVLFASSSFLISISLSAFLLLLISGSTSSFVKLNAACKSTPIRFGIYRSLKIVF